MENGDTSNDTNSSYSTDGSLRGGSIPGNQNGRRRQGRYWLLTIPRNLWEPVLPDQCSYIKGQAETGAETSYEHWQVLAVFKKKVSIAGVKSIPGFGTAHAELSRSSAANDYVWKEATRVDGTKFEFGVLPFKRNCEQDWERVWNLAVQGEIFSIPAQIRLSHYRSIRSINADFAEPSFIERQCVVFWGPTGTGKSRRAWSEAGPLAYPKDPRSKFWCGYKGQENVVLDEFRGDIDISHLLRWLDRYPVIVEIKGSSIVLSATTIWITSNLSPRQWYPNLDDATYAALERRLQIVEFE